MLRPVITTSSDAAVTETNSLVVAQGLQVRAANEDGDSDDVEEQRRDVEDVVGPVAPPRHEPVEITEDLLGPQVHAALVRVPVRQLDDGQPLRPEEEQQCEDPQPDRHGPAGGDRRHCVEIQHRDHEQAARDRVAPALGVRCGMPA